MLPYSLYVAGHNLDVTKIYPDVSYPVPRGTPMLSPLIKWEHSVDWNLRHHNDTQKLSKTGSSVVSIDVQNQDFEYLMGHNVDGKLISQLPHVLVCVQNFDQAFCYVSIGMGLAITT